MQIALVYGLVVIVWSTTPLGIVFSSDSVSFMAAVTLRMALALVGALLILAVLRQPLFQQKTDAKVFFAASLAIFPSMPLVYWAAQYIPSGLISVLMGLGPLFTGVASILVLGENPFNLQRLIGLGVALLGLVVIFIDQLSIGMTAVMAVLGTVVSCIAFSFCSVLLKRLSGHVAPLRQTTGALLFALPGLLLSWWLVDGTIPEEWSFKTVSGTLYLAVMGSLVGFSGYFYLIHRLSVSTVSLITLVTPVLALGLGVMLAGESVSGRMLMGSALILLALVFYQGLLGRLLKRRERKVLAKAQY